MITYTDTLQRVKEADLAGFYGAWAQAPTPAVQLRLLAGTAARVIAVEETSGKVVGFLGVALDATGEAYVPLMEVLPAYKGLGIASELTRRMMAKLAPGLVREPLGGRFLPRVEFRAGA